MLTRSHSFGQFKKHALLKARTQSPCFSYPGLARALQSAGSADFYVWVVSVLAVAPDLLCLLPVSDRAKMQPVYLLTVALTDFLLLFCIK
jgi:hypothetical protein